MKTLFIFLFSLVTILECNAQSYTWTNGGGDNNFENPLNWSPTPPFGYPSFGETAVFDGSVSNANCVMPFDEDFLTLILQSNYSGLIDASGVDLTLTNLSLQGGTLVCPTATFHISGNLVKGGTGVFSVSGTSWLDYNLTSSTARTINGTFAFNNLSVSATGSGNRILSFGAGTSSCSTLLLNGAANAMAYRGSINVTSALKVLGTSATAAPSNTGTIVFTGAGAKTITGTGSAGQNPIGNITFNCTGGVSMSGNLAVSGIWKTTSIGAFTQGTSVVTMLGGTVTSGTATTAQAYFDNLSTTTSSTTIFSSNSYVTVNGNLTNSGSITTNNALLRLNGTGAQSVSGNSISINGIEISNTGTKSLITPVNVLDSVKISAAGTLATGGNLTLKSTTSLKGRLAQIAAGGSVSGNVTVETFAKGGSAGWAELGASGIQGLTFNSWYGQIAMTIEGSATGVTSAGGLYFESVQGWNEADAYGYDTTIVVTSPITVGKGYWVYLASNNTSANDMVWTVSGPPVTGNVTINLTKSLQNGDNLIANPYASPISWTKLRNGNTNVNNAVYTYNADGGVYASFVNGVGTNGGSDVIPMGQGFYVSANAATSLVAAESNKVSFNTSSNQLLRLSSPEETSSTNIGQVFKLKLNGSNGDFDETAFRFHSVATPAYDSDWDAVKIFATPGYAGYPGVYSFYTTISSKSGNKDYSVNSLPPITTQSVSIPLLVKVMSTGSYTISPVDLQNFSNPSCLVLRDKLLNINHQLSNGPYICTISDTTSAPRFELNICAQSIPTSVSNNVIEENNIQISQDQQGAFVKTSFNKSTKAVISVYNIVGQQLTENITVNGTENTTYLNLNTHNQVVLIRVTTDKESVVKKVVLH
ncbi:MAG: hypothetical protein H0W61_02695 [Bacteroidetes bacterium]|nr:hypothetical protein [Bacteroidota bacterium]